MVAIGSLVNQSSGLLQWRQWSVQMALTHTEYGYQEGRGKLRQEHEVHS